MGLSMKVPIALWAFSVFVFVAFPLAAMDHGDPVRGAELAHQCEGCHGVEGNNRIDGFPNLSNQKYKYLVKQLREMRTSAKQRVGVAPAPQDSIKQLMRQRRTNEIMDAFVFDLSDTDINDLAAYYAEQPCPAATPGAPLPPPRFETRCQVCHGEFGVAKNSNIPNIAGQDFPYLEQQLLAFKSGRIEEGDGQEKRRAAIMEGQVRNLSDQDITDISLYYARLPCR